MSRVVWLGIAMLDESGRSVGVEIDGEDLIDAPSLDAALDIGLTEADLLSLLQERGLQARYTFAVAARRIRLWAAGEAQARARRRAAALEAAPREIGP